jgi:hypothetical protein
MFLNVATFSVTNTYIFDKKEDWFFKTFLPDILITT